MGTLPLNFALTWCEICYLTAFALRALAQSASCCVFAALPWSRSCSPSSRSKWASACPAKVCHASFRRLLLLASGVRLSGFVLAVQGCTMRRTTRPIAATAAPTTSTLSRPSTRRVRACSLFSLSESQQSLTVVLRRSLCSARCAIGARLRWMAWSAKVSVTTLSVLCSTSHGGLSGFRMPCGLRI